jgi:hypothetical protein
VLGQGSSSSEARVGTDQPHRAGLARDFGAEQAQDRAADVELVIG